MKRNLFLIAFAIALAFGLWWALPTQTALAATCTWIGTTSIDWGTATNWSCGIVPTSTDDVTIPSGPSNQPTISSAAVANNITIASGATLAMTGGSLTIYGNLDSEGAFTSSTGIFTTFAGSAKQTVSGAGSTAFGILEVANTATSPNNIVEVMPTTFSADSGFLRLTRGILKLSGSFSLSNQVFQDNNYWIATNSGIWLNNANVTVTPASGGAPYPRLNGGVLHITAGTYYIGGSKDQYFIYDSGTLIIDGGSLIVSGRFGPYADTSSINLTMSDGIFTVGEYAGVNESGVALFDITGSSSTVAISGGTLILQNENKGTGFDFLIDYTVTTSYTGGTLQLGSSATTDTAPSFVLDASKFPSLSIVSNGTSTPSVSFNSFDTDLTIQGNVTIGANATLDTTGYNLYIPGNSKAPGNWTNNGTFVASTRLVKFTDTSAAQTIGGANATPFYDLYILNTTSTGVTLGHDISVTGLYLYIDTTATFTLGSYNVTVLSGTLINNGMLRQTKNVSSGDVSFFATGGYGGVIINPVSTPLGSTTVSVWGNHNCTTITDETVKRCFYINPTNTPGNATITFFYASSENGTGGTCDNMNAYHNNGGGNWGSALTLDTTYDGDGRLCSASPYSLRVTGVSSFSPFALRSVAPTVIQLRNLTAQSTVRISVALLALALGFVAIGTAWVYLRRRKVQ